MKKITILLIFIIFASCKNTQTKIDSSVGKDDSNQTIYFGGDIVTMEGESLQYAEAVVQENGKIVFVGTKKEANTKYADATPYDLKGQTMMPGFIEPHLHPMIAATILSGDIVAPYDWTVPEGVKKGVQNLG